MSPPLALPCEKIHPFYLHRYFCVTTLVSFVEKSLDPRLRGDDGKNIQPFNPPDVKPLTTRS